MKQKSRYNGLRPCPPEASACSPPSHRHLPPAPIQFQRDPSLALLHIRIDQSTDHILDMRVAFALFAADGADEAVGDLGLAAAFLPERDGLGLIAQHGGQLGLAEPRAWTGSHGHPIP